VIPSEIFSDRSLYVLFSNVRPAGFEPLRAEALRFETELPRPARGHPIARLWSPQNRWRSTAF
jgi:hypothetical protein